MAGHNRANDKAIVGMRSVHGAPDNMQLRTLYIAYYVFQNTASGTAQDKIYISCILDDSPGLSHVILAARIEPFLPQRMLVLCSEGMGKVAPGWQHRTSYTNMC